MRVAEALRGAHGATAPSRSTGATAPRIEADAEPTCTEGVCQLRFVVSESDAAERREIGYLWVDPGTHQVSWQPNDGRTKRWEITAYARYVRDRGRAENAVAALADVKHYCKTLETVHQLHCLIWVDEAPENIDCVPDGSVLDECLWSVYVGEAHTTHSARMATFFVDVRSETVVAAAPLDCDRMSIGSWRSRRNASARNPSTPPPCPSSP